MTSYRNKAARQTDYPLVYLVMHEVAQRLRTEDFEVQAELIVAVEVK